MAGKKKIENHSGRDHALLSASGAHRWMNCTPSAKLEAEFGERTTSEYAQEGTLAHELAELYLSKDATFDIDRREFEIRLEQIMSSDLFNDEMLDMVPVYTDYCIEQFNEAKADNSLSVMEIEQRLDLTDFIPDGFGTADCVILNDNLMEIIDLKYGRGVAVSAEQNSQLMLYALGALRKYDAFYDISEVRMTIVQPRLGNISSWQISVKELYEWADKELKPKAELAIKGEGELAPGDWCKFCSIKNRCRKLHDQQMEIAKYDFKLPPLLSDEEVADIALRASKFTDWINSVHEYAQSQAVNNGKKWPGLKLVEGQSRRKWADEDKAAFIIKNAAKLTDEDIYNMKLKSITEIEKMVGKKAFSDIAKIAVVKPAGKPVLVPESDKRPAMGIDQAKADFAE